ncbi:unnamed protein product [Absidia cylindrospora]
MSVDDDEAPQVRSIGNVVSVKSSRSYHNIPLVPPPPPPAPISKQPDDLISNVSPEQRARIITNGNINHQNTLKSLPIPPETAQQDLSEKPALTIPNVEKNQHHQPSSSTNTIPSNTIKPTAPIYQETLKDHTIIDRTSSILSTSRSPSPSPTPTPRWSVSTRKSSVSYSIYSTFGSDSFTSQEALDSTTTASTSASSSSCLSLPNHSKDHLQRLQLKQQDLTDDLSSIVTTNVQHTNHEGIMPISNRDRNQEDSPCITKKQSSGNSHGNVPSINTNDSTQSAHRKNEEDNSNRNDINGDIYDSDGDSDSGDDDDDDVFVDATGYSQDDMERERYDGRLSKRLSGGHYGSAGGLLFSLEAAQRRTKQQQKHRFSNGITSSIPKVPPLLVDHHTLPATTTTTTMTVIPTDTSTEKDQPDELTQFSTTSPTSILFDDSQLSSFWNENPSLVLNEFGSGFLSPSVSTHSSKSMDDSIHTTDTHEAKDMAETLWNEDESFVTKDHMAEWLGTRKSLNSLVLVHYLDYFDFATLRLDDAFRKLCSKLYFKAEAQQIDRILDVFAKRYWECNLQSIFGSSDVVYAVVYSLLLLNTDLHVAQGNYARMTKQAFVKNTMSTIHDQSSVKITKAWEMNMESYLKDLYTSVKQYQILQPLSERPVDHGPTNLDKRSSLIGGRRVLEMKRNMGAIIRKSIHEPNIVVEEPELIISPVQSPSSPSSSSQQRKRDSISSVGSSASSLRNPPSLLTPHSQPLQSISAMNSSGFFLDSNQSQYMKEGVLVRKHLLENATQKAKHRDWRECFSVVGDGDLKMYTIQGGFQQASYKVSSSDMDRRSMLRSSGIGFNSMTDSLASKPVGTTQEALSNGNKWGAFSQLIGTISLSHSLANVLPPPGYNRQRSFVFAIQQSHGGVYLFQAGSQAQVNEWASTCNYWAARQSKEPLPGGVSNMEYGWGNCLHDVILNLDEDDLLRQEQPIGVFQHQQSNTQNHQEYGSSLSCTNEIMIYDWRPPVPPMVSSNLNERDQHKALQRHLNTLNSDINEHREIKKKMMVKFPSKHPQHSKVMSNWELKSKYLLHEIIKYQNYCDALEKSIFDQSTNDSG